MAQSSAKGSRGARANKTETVSVRLDPKLRYMAELAARKQRRSLSSYIEWAVERSLNEIPIYEGSGYNGDDSISMAAAASSLWDIDEAERFVLLAINYQDLMDVTEQERWKLLMDSMLLSPAKQRSHSGNLTWDKARLHDVVLPEIRQHWDSLLQAHDQGTVAMREWVATIRKKVTSGEIYPLKLLAPTDASSFDEDIPF